MTDLASVAPPRATLGSTDRRDAWWLGPAITFLVLASFVVYATLRAFMNRDYEVGELLSPFYSPNLGHWTPLPQWLSPALLILWAPGGFRVTCYYYRKAYYRSFAADPPGCAVSEGKRRNYRGETAFPFILQNLHRYLLYAALLVLIFLWYDVWRALLARRPLRCHRRYACPFREYVAAFALHLFLSFASASGRRKHRLFLLQRFHAQPPEIVGRDFDPQCQSHELGLAQSVRSVVRRFLCLDGGLRTHCELENLLAWRKHRTARVRRHRHRGRRCWPACGDRSFRPRGEDGVGLQESSRKGAHGDGRGRNRRCPRTCGSAGRLEDSLSRHHARRQFLNHWRMAQLHAQEAPDRVPELENGEPSSIARKTAASFSAPSEATPTSVSRTSATAPVWN